MTDIQTPSDPARPAMINEKHEAKALTPPIAWPSFVFMGLLILAHWGMIIAGLMGVIPLWALILPLGYTAYAHYTLVHESIHGNFIQDRRYAWLHTLIGWYGSFILFTPFPLLERTHKHHHSFVNSEKDPDIYVKMSFPRLLLRNLISWALQLLPVKLLQTILPETLKHRGYLGADKIMSLSELRQYHITNWIWVGLLWGAVFAGFGWEVVTLFYLPLLIALNMLVIMFQWLPHHPFKETGRYSATRNTGMSGLNLIFLWQNWHLMHHLWPSVPFYNYERLYHSLRPVLEEKGARHHEGLVPNAGDIDAEPVAAE